MSPTQLFEQLVAEIIPGTVYANDPLPIHKPGTDSKRSTRARLRTATRRAARRMKYSMEAR